MKLKDYEKLKEKETPKNIIARYINHELTLTKSQLDEILNLKGPIAVGVNCKKG